MPNASANPGRWLDIVMLPTAGVLLLPIVALSLAPVLFTFIVLWPLLILPIVAVPRALPPGAAPRPKLPRFRGLRLGSWRQVPQAA